MEERYQLLRGSCAERLREMGDNSVDAVVTDPPYGFKFMGKKWDYDVPSVDAWVEVLRVLKPGGHLISFGGARTYHRLVVNVEDAGFEIRDQIMWIYGQGFPKSHNVSKEIGKKKGAQRPKERMRTDGRGRSPQKLENTGKGDTGVGHADGSCQQFYETSAATEEAKKWEGWGTALKPSHEPIVLARKTPSNSIALNLLEWGTGAININDCLIRYVSDYDKKHQEDIAQGQKSSTHGRMFASNQRSSPSLSKPSGRWPANVILDDSEEVHSLFPQTKSGYMKAGTNRKMSEGTDKTTYSYWKSDEVANSTFGDSGSAARFFYCAKANKKERTENGQVDNKHPTVKPTQLMRYLCRLVTPPDGVVLDPFMGSGSTGRAALMEGFRFIGIDDDSESVRIARERLSLLTD